MLTVDIISPLGGDVGGVENVIRRWTQELDADKINLRIFHCYQGGAYLQGYPKQWSVNVEYKRADINHLIDAFAAFIQAKGAPDLCIAANWPMMVFACAYVRQQMGLSDMKIISWVHNQISAYEEEGLGGVTELINADAHFAISHQIAEDILVVDKNARIFEIGNPVDFVPFIDRGVAYDPYLLCYVGRFTYIKRIDIILEAIYRAKGPWHIRIIGDGEIRPEIEGWIRLLQLDNRVELMGWRADPWLLCEDSRIFVSASDYEGFLMSACEAASRGKTILSTPVEGLVDYLVEGENGYLFPFEDANALAHILDGIENGSISLCDMIGARRSVERYETGNYFQTVMWALYEVAGL